MKSLRIVFLIIFGVAQMVAFSQTVTKPTIMYNVSSLSLSQFTNASNGIGLKLGGFKLENPRSLLIYNSNTGTNDIFSLTQKEEQPWRYERKGSVILLENKFRGYKIDSFNPYGAESLEQGILVGVLNLLLK